MEQIHEALPASRSRRFLAGRSRQAALRDAARFLGGLEDAGSAIAQEYLVSHRRAVRGFQDCSPAEGSVGGRDVEGLAQRRGKGLARNAKGGRAQSVIV